MKAIVQDRYGSVDTLDYADIDAPVAPVDRVLVRIRAAGVDPSVWHLMTGKPYLVRLAGEGVRKPKTRVRGVDFAGTIESLGANATGFHPGDEVYGVARGSFAELADARPDRIAPKPSSLSYEQAAAVPVSACTALQGLRDKGKIQAGQHTLVIGAGGGVGTFAVQLASAFGAEVTGVCSTTKVDLVRSIGADHVIDYTAEDVTDGSRRFDLILDTGGSRPLSKLRRALTPSGRIVIVGGEGGGPVFGTLGRLLAGVAISPFVKQKAVGFLATVRTDDLRFLTELIEAGKLRPVIDRTYPLVEAPAAVAYQQQGHARGKVVVAVSGA